MPEIKKDPAPKMARGIVATGRTVSVPTDRKRIATFTAEGKAVHQSIERQAHPGEEIELPADEIDHLRAAGYLVDPDAPVVERGAGPRFARRA